MKISWKHQIAIGVSVLVVLILSIGATIIFIQPKIANVADMLPADRTVALFQNISKTDAIALQQHFHFLTDVPLTDTPATVAVIDDANGNRAWFLLERSNTPGGDAFTVKASDPLHTPLPKSSSALSHDKAYTRILQAEQADQLWAFVRFPAFNQVIESGLPSFVLPNQPVGLRWNDDVTNITFAIPDTDTTFSTMLNGTEQAFQTELFSLDTADASALLQSLPLGVNDDALLPIKTVLMSLMTDITGTDTSPTYDVLPLISHELHLHLAEASGSTLLFALSAKTDVPHLDDAIALLHTNATSTLATFSPDTRVFDKDKLSTILKIDPTLLQNSSEQREGWTIRKTGSDQSGQWLLSAVRGNNIVLSNDPSAFEKLLNGAQTPLPIVAQGMIDRTATNRLLHELLPTLWKEESSSTLHWNASTDGKTMTITTSNN